MQDFDADQRALWAQVVRLWDLARDRDELAIRDALHPRYSGWVTGTAAPHDRDAALRAVGPEAPRIVHYTLEPLAVTVFDGAAGVAHYRYVAEIEGAARPIEGRWTEVYVARDGVWQMIAVSGGPDGQR